MCIRDRGEVIKSNNDEFKVGQFVSGWGGAQEFCISSGENYNKIYPGDIPLPTFLGYLGMPGMTAYFGILQEGEIKEGDMVLVSAAAGAVGSLVGQIAKIKGCRVVGIAGGKEKCDLLINELGFDDAIDDSDQVFENSNVKVVIDKFSFTHLEGGTLNFSDGLNGTGFGIENPNAKASCGCGSSFTV